MITKIPLPTNEQLNDLKSINESPQNRMAYTVGDYEKLTIPTYDGSGQTVHPSVVFSNRGIFGYKFWMLHTPYPDSNNFYEQPSICASNDGINWVVPAGLVNPISPKPAVGFQPDTSLVYLSEENKLRAYFAHLGAGESGEGGTYYSESTDGIIWSERIKTTGSEAGLLPDAGITRVSPDDYIGYFSGGYAIGKNPSQSWRRYKSQDGISWTVEAPAITNISTKNRGHAVTSYFGGRYHYLASVNNKDGGGSNLMYGTSVDGMNIQFDRVPLLTPKSWADSRIYTGQVVQVQDKYWVYFSADTIEGKWWVGRVEIKLNSLPDTRLVLNTKHLHLIDKLELRSDTAYYVGGGAGIPIVEFNYYKNKTLFVTNKLGVDVTLRILPKDTTGYSASSAQDILIPSSQFNALNIYTEGDLKILGFTTPFRVFLSVKTATAPVEGFISVSMSCTP